MEPKQSSPIAMDRHHYMNVFASDVVLVLILLTGFDIFKGNDSALVQTVFHLFSFI